MLFITKKKLFTIQTGGSNIAVLLSLNMPKKMDSFLSTTQQYDPYENAVAERVNENF